MNVERRVTDVVHSVNPTFQVHWIHLERPRATPERQNEQYYRKVSRSNMADNMRFSNIELIDSESSRVHRHTRISPSLF